MFKLIFKLLNKMVRLLLLVNFWFCYISKVIFDSINIDIKINEKWNKGFKIESFVVIVIFI